MKDQFSYEEEDFEYPESDDTLELEEEEFEDSEYYEDSEFENLFELEEEVNRNSREYVRWIQESLNKILGINLVVDGIIGPKTRGAIKSFQQKNRLEVDGIVGPITESELIKTGASLPPGAGSNVNIPSYPQPISGVPKNIVTIALQEWNRWNKGNTKENSTSMRNVPSEYWNSTPGGSNIISKNNWWSNYAWSAAFICYVVRKAGAGNAFKYSSYHTTYTYYAKQNRINGVSNTFKAYRVSEKKPDLGDIIVQNYDRSNRNYDSVQPNISGAHGDIVVEVSSDHVKVIGGNVGESVSLRKYPINSNGYLSSGKHWAIVTFDKKSISSEEVYINGGKNEELNSPSLLSELFFELENSAVNRKSKEYIRWIQNSLNNILGLNLSLDGIIGHQTRSAIRSFQQKKGLAVDGNLGPNTEAALISAGAEPFSQTKPITSKIRMVDPNKVSCAKLNRNFPIFKAIGTKDPVGVLEAISQRAVEMLNNTITELTRISDRVSAGEPPAWPLIGDQLALALQNRMLMHINDQSAWTGKGPRTAEQIIRWLSKIRNTIAGGHLWYTCLAATNCNPTTWAWVYVGKYRIYLCRSFWIAKPGIDALTHFEFQAQTIIHEVSHIYYDTEDSGRGPGHAECISQFVADANGSPIDRDFSRRCVPSR